MNISLSIPGDVDGLNLAGTVEVDAAVTPTPLRVEFYLDSALVSTVASAPYKWMFDTTKVTDGTHQLRAESVYKTRRGKASEAVTVNNSAPPPSPPPPTVTTKISGTARVGQTLTGVIS